MGQAYQFEVLDSMVDFYVRLTQGCRRVSVMSNAAFAAQSLPKSLEGVPQCCD